MLWLAILVFIVTLVFVIWQPRGLSIGWPAVGGALLALGLGVVHWHDVWSVTKIVWDATLTFVAIIVTSTILDEVGFFEWAALKMAHAARGNGRHVFLYVTLLGAVISAFFANDGAALILTPIVLEKVKLLKFDLKRMIPFVMAGGFIADSTSLPFTVSNLVNIVSADFFHIGFVSYCVRMIVPDLFSIAASVLVLYWFYRKDIPRTYHPGDLSDPMEAVVHRGMFRISWLVLVILMLGYLVTEQLHMPVSFIAILVAIVFLIIGRQTRVIQPWRILRNAPWSIVVFSVGMYVVVYGLRNAGLTDLLGHTLAASAHHGLYAGTLAMGFLAALFSSVMNNMPSVMIGALAIDTTHTPLIVREAFVYANVIGCDLGPKITPIGSLATLLWLHVLGKKGVTISWGAYFRAGIVLTVPTLFVTLTGLYWWLRIIH